MSNNPHTSLFGYLKSVFKEWNTLNLSAYEELVYWDIQMTKII